MIFMAQSLEWDGKAINQLLNSLPKKVAAKYLVAHIYSILK